MHIVLIEPEIPQNTGNIARSCAATGSSLHLVGKLGFSTDDKYLKRSGLDYWHLLDIHYHDHFESLRQAYPENNFYFATTKGAHVYTEMQYQPDDFLVFGKETKGIPEELLKQNLDHCVRIPIISEARSLNLSNSVAIVLFEALRQQGFYQLQYYGKLKDL